MKCILLLFFFQVSFLSYGQKVDWTKTKNWKIYALNKDSAFSYRVDTLSHFQFAAMGDSLVISFISHATQLPKRIYPNWMGMYFASYETHDGQLRKVVLSSYGGFFFDSFTRRYYELPSEWRKKWNEFLNLNLKKVFDE